jgi:hypothetical protein
MLRTNKRNIEENRIYRSFKSLIKTRIQSCMSFQSASPSSIEQGVFDSNTLSDSEFPRCSRSGSSSREIVVSGVYTCWFNSDIDSSRYDRKDEQRSVRESEISKITQTKVSDTRDNGRINMAEESFEITVLCDGTRLMKDILFPTVIVKMPKKRLRTSMVYYIVLTTGSGLYVEDIPCLLYSNSTGNKKEVQTAELLPLRMVSSETNSTYLSLSPLLFYDQYRCLFHEGFTFKVKAIKSGRRVSRKQRPWKYYELGKLEMMHDLLRRLICLDIRQMPK